MTEQKHTPLAQMPVKIYASEMMLRGRLLASRTWDENPYHDSMKYVRADNYYDLVAALESVLADSEQVGSGAYLISSDTVSKIRNELAKVSK
jgi:hypothetical protein